MKGILAPTDAHLFARAYPWISERGDYEVVRQTIRDDMQRGCSWWLGEHDPKLTYEMDDRLSKTLHQKLPGLCATCYAESYPSLAEKIWQDALSPSGWVEASPRIAIFEGIHVGVDPAGYPLFRPNRLLAIVESNHAIALYSPTLPILNRQFGVQR